MTFSELLSNPDSIKPLIKPMGFCIISCKIINESEPIGYMYRERGGEEEDSGWRFLSGNETEEYTEDDDNYKVVDLTIVANYDPAIIPHLLSKYGSEFERTEDCQQFIALIE
jgi:hypothetical protein